MGLLGSDSKNKTEVKVSPEEQLLRPLVVRRSINPGTADSSQLARGMGVEALSRLYEPARMDPRTATILASLLPQMATARESGVDLLQDFFRTPTGRLGANASPFSTAPPWQRPGMSSGLVEALIGSRPAPATTNAITQTGGRLSRSIIDQLLQPTTPGQNTYDIIGRSRRATRSDNQKYLFEQLFGVPSPPADND